jgi:excisionase family DNA binding protein
MTSGPLSECPLCNSDLAEPNEPIPAPKPKNRRVRAKEVAERLGVSRHTAIALMRRGTIPGSQMIYKDERGREHWRADRNAFETWAENSFADVDFR